MANATIPLYDPLGLFWMYPTKAGVQAVGAFLGSDDLFGIPMKMFNTAVTNNYFTGPFVSALRDWVSVNTFPTAIELPLVRDPVDAFFCVFLYFVGLLFFLFVGRITGKLELRGFGVVHNAFLVLLSAYMCVALFYSQLMVSLSDNKPRSSGPIILWNLPVADPDHPWAFPCAVSFWVFYMSKLVEYADTYIMALKHNYRQLSFLHLYHHSSILLVSWVFLVAAPGGDSYWCAAVNSGIHVVMYSYYLLNLVFPKGGRVRAILFRYKFFITYAQLTQFVLNAVQTIYVVSLSGMASPLSFLDGYRRMGAAVAAAVSGEQSSMHAFWGEVLHSTPRDALTSATPPNVEYPAFTMHVNFWYMVTMLALFGNFLSANKKQRSSKGGAAPRRKVKQD